MLKKNKLRRSAISPHLPRLFLARHGDTAWTESRQHTGRTDPPLNERGERNAAFSSGHTIRMIAARWLGLPPAAGTFFFCRPASVGVFAYEHDNRDEPIIFKWNYMRLPRE